MPPLKTIIFETANGVATITLNRPKSANGLNLLLSQELAYCARQCDNDPSIKAVILTGKGRFFCAGGDVKEMASFGDQLGLKIKELADNLHTAISTFSRMKAPVIVAVNGIAAGAGFSLAISGDIVVSDDKASFIMAYTKAGLSPDGGSSYYLPRLIGIRRTQELMLTNRQLSANEACDWGLVTETVSSDELMNRAKELAKSIANGPANANAAIKTLLLGSFNNSLETQMEIEGREISKCAMSADGREGIEAFTSKRNPVFE